MRGQFLGSGMKEIIRLSEQYEKQQCMKASVKFWGVTLVTDTDYQRKTTLFLLNSRIHQSHSLNLVNL